MNINTQIIDAYLNNELNSEEIKAFENRLKNEPALKQELEIQKNITIAASNYGLKANFKKAIKQHLFKKLLLKIGLVLSIAAIAIISFFALTKKNAPNNSLSNISVNNANDSINNNAKPYETFKIEANTDNIIETKDGFIFGIPANAFNTTEKNVEIKIQTAINPYDIIKLGLSTTSNGTLLKTAGMFNIMGFTNGQEVNLNKEIQVNIPANTIDPNMQLFKEEKDSLGNINWVNPKKIENNLKPVDITKLNFYPKNYLPTLKLLNKAYKNKYYTDSLYYSYSGYNNYLQSEEYLPDPTIILPPQDTIGSAIWTTDSILKYRNIYNKNQRKETLTSNNYNNQIDPAIIQTIWNSNYNNTLLATAAFEERLQYLHTLCNNEYIYKYIKNLDKALYQIDQELADITSGETKQKFLSFAKRKDGKVANNTSMQQKLNSYFETKYLANKEATALTNKKYFDVIDAQNEKAYNKENENASLNQAIKNNNYNQEFEINLIDVYKQMGITYPVGQNNTNTNITNQNKNISEVNITRTNNYYSVNIINTGWYNVDAYTALATYYRKTDTIFNKETGKSASVNYSEVQFNINNYETFNGLNVYLLPKNLNSFQKITNNTSGLFTEKLNAIITYQAVFIGYKNGKSFYAKMEKVQTGIHNFTLIEITEENLKTMLNAFSPNKFQDLEQELKYTFFQHNDLARQLKQSQEDEFRIKIAKSIFSCYSPQNQAPSTYLVPTETTK